MQGAGIDCDAATGSGRKPDMADWSWWASCSETRYDFILSLDVKQCFGCNFSPKWLDIEMLGDSISITSEPKEIRVFAMRSKKYTYGIDVCGFTSGYELV